MSALPPNPEFIASSGSPLRANSGHGIVTGIRAHWLSLGRRGNYSRARPIFRKDVHDQYPKRHARLVLGCVCEIARFIVVVTCFVDCFPASLVEREFARNNVSD